MTLQVAYERPHQRNEPESLPNIIIKHVAYNFKSIYPEKNNSFYFRRTCEEVCSVKW